MKIIAGVDEVGRGSLIGPVYAAAVILNKSINKKLLKDSKCLKKSRREILSKYIKKNSIWAIGSDSAASPDQAKSMCTFIRKLIHNKKNNIEGLKIIYGGSVNSKNALQLCGLDSVDGALIGRGS